MPVVASWRADEALRAFCLILDRRHSLLRAASATDPIR